MYFIFNFLRVFKVFNTYQQTVALLSFLLWYNIITIMMRYRSGQTYFKPKVVSEKILYMFISRVFLLI